MIFRLGRRCAGVAPSVGGAALVINKKEARTVAGVEVIVGLFDKLFKRQPDPDPVEKEKPAAAPPPAPEVIETVAVVEVAHGAAGEKLRRCLLKFSDHALDPLGLVAVALGF